MELKCMRITSWFKDEESSSTQTRVSLCLYNRGAFTQAHFRLLFSALGNFFSPSISPPPLPPSLPPPSTNRVWSATLSSLISLGFTLPAAYLFKKFPAQPSLIKLPVGSLKSVTNEGRLKSSLLKMLFLINCNHKLNFLWVWRAFLSSLTLHFYIISLQEPRTQIISSF